MRVILDFETFSEIDLKVAGAWAYSMHPSTEVLCVGYKIDDQEPKLWRPDLAPEQPYDLYMALLDQRTIVVAHNAFFEFCIWQNCLREKYPQHFNPLTIIEHKRMSCTAARARHLALPGHLDGLCKALNLDHQKDMTGHKLMLKMCKPKRPSKLNPSIRHNTPEQMQRLGEYCLHDIKAEYELDKILPPLPKSERELWLFDQMLNARGITADVEACKLIKSQIKTFTEKLTEELQDVSGGALQTAGQNEAIRVFCEAQGFDLENAQKKTVATALKNKGLTPQVRRVLEIRQSLSKSSTKKYDAFIAMADTKGKIRDLWRYHSASTGRWGGAGIQPQNFPRGTVSDLESALEAVRLNNAELFSVLYDEPMEVFSSLLRSMITVEKGKELFCADFAGIELRVLMWLVGQENALKMIRAGGDLYCYQASDIFKRTITKEDKAERFIGKEAVLGMGFGMGGAKFFKTVIEKGGNISPELAKKAVQSYRSKFDRVPKFWDRVERAAIQCVNTKKPVDLGRVKFEMRQLKRGQRTWDFLVCILPSGRPLWYSSPSVKNKLTHWGQVKPQLHYWEVDPKTKQWAESHIYGGKWTENIVQAIARDLMAHGALNCERQGFEILLMVHDELLASKPLGVGSVEEFEKLMCDIPLWARGCPVTSEGWKGLHYKK